MTIRRIEVRERLMEKNDVLARDVRLRLGEAGVPSFNLVSSPGSGKTLLLERTLQDLGQEIRMAVVTGDVQTQNDADRLAAHTDNLVQAVLTGGACHLDAKQILTALEHIDLNRTDLIFIENVGNLVCPASWDYALLNKIDLRDYLDFDVDRAIRYAHQVNPDLRFFVTSALTGAGLDDWCTFVEAHARDAIVA